jgi:hypothetical protein
MSGGPTKNATGTKATKHSGRTGEQGQHNYTISPSNVPAASQTPAVAGPSSNTPIQPSTNASTGKRSNSSDHEAENGEPDRKKQKKAPQSMRNKLANWQVSTSSNVSTTNTADGRGPTAAAASGNGAAASVSNFQPLAWDQNNPEIEPQPQGKYGNKFFDFVLYNLKEHTDWRWSAMSNWLYMIWQSNNLGGRRNYLHRYRAVMEWLSEDNQRQQQINDVWAEISQLVINYPASIAPKSPDGVSRQKESKSKRKRQTKANGSSGALTSPPSYNGTQLASGVVPLSSNDPAGDVIDSIELNDVQATIDPAILGDGSSREPSESSTSSRHSRKPTPGPFDSYKNPMKGYGPRMKQRDSPSPSPSSVWSPTPTPPTKVIPGPKFNPDRPYIGGKGLPDADKTPSVQAIMKNPRASTPPNLPAQSNTPWSAAVVRSVIRWADPVSGNRQQTPLASLPSSTIIWEVRRYIWNAQDNPEYNKDNPPPEGKRLGSEGAFFRSLGRANDVCLEIYKEESVRYYKTRDQTQLETEHNITMELQRRRAAGEDFATTPFNATIVREPVDYGEGEVSDGGTTLFLVKPGRLY